MKLDKLEISMQIARQDAGKTNNLILAALRELEIRQRASEQLLQEHQRAIAMLHDILFKDQLTQQAEDRARQLLDRSSPARDNAVDWNGAPLDYPASDNAIP